MFDSLKPGQTITLTVSKAPRTPSAISTVERLMRRDLDSRRGLRRAQRLRRQNMVVYNRGNRDWYKRERCGKIVRPVMGATWTMKWTPDLAPEFKTVEKYLSVSAK